MRWYRIWLTSFPTRPRRRATTSCWPSCCTRTNSCAAAATEYEKVAYGYPEAREKRGSGLRRPALLRRPEAFHARAAEAAVASALRSAEAFPDDARTGSVLTNARRPAVRAEGRRAGRQGRAARARHPQRHAGRAPHLVDRDRTHRLRGQGLGGGREGYGEAIALSPEGAGRNELTERLAAAVCQQGDAARNAGKTRDAVAAFERVATLAPNCRCAPPRSTTPRPR